MPVEIRNGHAIFYVEDDVEPEPEGEIGAPPDGEIGAPPDEEIVASPEGGSYMPPQYFIRATITEQAELYLR